MRDVGLQVVCAVVVVLLQAIAAPYLGIGYAIPNFALALALAYPVASRDPHVIIMPFAVGLMYDLLGSGPVGACALICTLSSLFAVFVCERMDNDTAFIPLAVICVVVLVAEILYACLCVACGWDVGLGEALLWRALPAWLYDTVIAVIIYFILRLILVRHARKEDMTTL